MSKFEQNAVSKVVWPWTEEAPAAVKKGLPRPVRALIQFVIMCGIVGILIWWKGQDHFFWKIVAGFAGVVLVSGLIIPPLFDKIEAFGQWLGRSVALAVTYILLVPFYYLVFAPGHLLLIILGKDPMHRKFPTDLKTYWIPRPAVENMNQYKKQH